MYKLLFPLVRFDVSEKWMCNLHLESGEQLANNVKCESKSPLALIFTRNPTTKGNHFPFLQKELLLKL